MRHAVATAAVTLAALGVLSTSRWALAFESSQCHRRVAIVGGGVAGASTAFYLNRAFEADPQCSVSIDVFEAGPVVGGRVAETVIAGRRVEVGGTIAVHDNRYMREWADASGTGRRSPSARESLCCSVAASQAWPVLLHVKPAREPRCCTLDQGRGVQMACSRPGCPADAA